MVNRLYGRLNEIKRRKHRLEMLKEICVDSDIINDALEIAKLQSSIYLPGVALVVAIAALIISFTSIVLKGESLLNFVIALPYFIALCYAVYFVFNLKSWMETYYDLIELRSMKREETKPTVDSKLEEIISEVVKIIPRIDILEEKVSTKIEEIMR